MDLIIHKQQNNYGGKIVISGAKNSAVAILPAALISNKLSVIHNIPDITDVKIIIDIMKEMGHFVLFSNNTVVIKRNNNCSTIFPDSVDKLRGSYYFIGAYANFLNKFTFKSCGGCDLGDRPIDYHLEAFKKLGASFITSDKGLLCDFSNMQSNAITLAYPSVGATINTILASVQVKGVTTIYNSAREPEVIDVCNFLVSMGASIKGIGTNTIIIRGSKNLDGTEYTIISDRIEAGTYLSLGSLPNVSKITVCNINPLYLNNFLTALKEIGLSIHTTDNSVCVSKNNSMRSHHTITGPYPEFSSDLAPILTVILSLCEGKSSITETVFSNRTSHIAELNKIGAHISIEGQKIIIEGKTKYTGGLMTSHDLRCSAALLLAGIASGEETIIKNIDSLFRGYDSPIQKLQRIGILCNTIN